MPLRAVVTFSERLAVEVTDRERGDLVHLLGVIGQMVLWRRETGLQLAIDTVRAVTKRFPWSFRGNVERAVLEGIGHMIGDTAIRPATRLDRDNSSEAMDVSRYLILRRAAARLAYTMFEHYSKLGTPFPATVCEWRTICQSDDEFSEIRNQWREGGAR